MLFADCRDYTSLTRQLGVETITPLINEFFRASFQIVVDSDGIVDHFLGDAVMAFFNVPIQHEDHAVRAVTAGTRILLAVPTINARVTGREVLQVGIGIASGWTYTSTVGTRSCHDYTVVGDTVNIASRLQGEARPGELLVTQETYEVVKGAFPHAQRRECQLKGIPEPVIAYVLT